ncbi:MAG TPA: SDR family oxidoreductase [Hyphomicrobiaceae bacterium]|jgi:NAD(P)-dependent dehydrogenase (short-subunit alcohol dehydrogenase family)|nr:SDR family oxidoreductase [Hyphomicrobiaceae bacterium]
MPHETVLITGAARRIGRTLALDFAARGWRVGLHCRTAADADGLAKDIGAAGGICAVLDADLAQISQVRDLVPRCAAALGPPTCLINNAATFAFDDIATLDPAAWDAQLAVNLKAPVFLAQALAAHLPAGAAGNIINMIDQRVLKPTPLFFSYGASKAALWSVTRTLAQALAPRIRVNAIGPGPALRSAYQTEEEFRRQCEATILGRGTSPQEIAAAVRFILDAPALTGQMIALDGGQHLAWDGTSRRG